MKYSWQSSYPLIGKHIRTERRSFAFYFFHRMRIIEVQNAALFHRRDFVHFSGMRPDHGTRTLLQWCVEQFLINCGGENHWMSAMSPIARNDNRRVRSCEGLNQRANQCRAHQRMIDWAQQHAV